MTIKNRLWLTAAAGMACAIAAPASAKDCGDMARITLDKGKVTAATLVEAGAFQPPAGSGPPPGIAAAGYKADRKSVV